MRDFIVVMAAIFSTGAAIIALPFFGFFHDDKFSNPHYATCRRSGYDEPTCMHRIQTMKPNNKMAMLEKGQS